MYGHREAITFVCLTFQVTVRHIMVRNFVLAVLAVVIAARINKHIDVVELIEHRAAVEDVQAGAPEEYFSTQKLDHTDASNSNVWSQRFFTNDEFYGGPGSPVFVYISGEWIARNTTVTSKGLHMNVLAKKHKALIVLLEHRFYGKSQPLPDFKVSSLQYLTAEQALKDLVNFQDHLAAKRNLTKDSKWIAFGGSYPGMLAAWAKLQHGSRFAGSVASSGPIDTQTNFYQYADKVEFGLNFVGGKECVDAVSDSLKAFHNVIASTKPEDVAQLNALFKPCTPLANDWDRAVLEAYVFYSFEGLSQANDYAAYGLKQACADFTKVGKTPLQKAADYFYLQIGDATCYNYDYQDNFLDASVTSTDVTTTGTNRQWTYQTCSEFGFGQNSASAKGIFSVLSYLDVNKAFSEVCRQAFNISAAQTDAAVVANRQKYGALKINVENVVFPTGNLDGWAALAPSNATGVVNPKSEVIDVVGLSHCGDMGAPDASDSVHLAWAHVKVEASVDRFLRDQC
ncbi:hypothetical protein DYB28_001470 [Aphanomyces astaci]|uniref:Serine carboxypeptidase S28 n=1 Tax=Aphanomyces astaci TaxID=112090 RepID=A0A9X8DIL8_APHAT|nr:hypothetical protein DYB28_001470 [Aphanomyces astaci]